MTKLFCKLPFSRISIYRQMIQFVELGESLVYKKRNTFVEFKRIRHDPHLSREQFQQIGIDEMPDNMKAEFISELYKVEKKRIRSAYINICPALIIIYRSILPNLYHLQLSLSY